MRGRSKDARERMVAGRYFMVIVIGVDEWLMSVWIEEGISVEGDAGLCTYSRPSLMRHIVYSRYVLGISL